MLAWLLIGAPSMGSAHGLVPPLPPHLVSSVVPANGVVAVWLPGPIDTASLRRIPRVTTAADEDLPGAISVTVGDYLAWRPTEPFPVGETLTLRLELDGQPAPEGDRDPLSAPFIFSIVEARTDNAFPGALVETHLTDFGMVTESCCEASCFETTRYAYVFALLTAEIEAAPSVRGQYVYAFAWEGMLPSVWSELPQISVLPETPDFTYEPCRELWAHSLVERESQMIARGCVAADTLVPEREEHPALDAELAYAECMHPPIELTEEWCELNRAACENDAAECPTYADECGLQRVRVPDAGTQTQLFPTRRIDHQDTNGCAASGLSPRNTAKPWALLLFGTLLAGVRAAGARAHRQSRRARAMSAVHAHVLQPSKRPLLGHRPPASKRLR